ncbi:virginiamycin B lyase, partial [Streptomyces solincola]
AKPHAVAAPRPGACWFTEWAGNRVGHLTAEGVLTSYDLPSPGSEPHGIAAGPDGALWVALETGAVARMTP